jgi:hypothetical protein
MCVARAGHDTAIEVSMHLIVLWSPESITNRQHNTQCQR